MSVKSGSTDSDEELHVYHLRIHDAELKDAGEWKLEVEDKYGAASTTCKLAVLEDEKKDKQTTEVNGRLSSSSDDEEMMTYKLRIHDADLKDSGKWKCEVVDKYGASSATCNLTVLDSETQKKNSNFRVSFKKQKEEEEEKSLIVDPKRNREEPRFRVSLYSQSKEEGKSVKFTCVADGNPMPRVTWFKDREPITGGSHLFISQQRDGTACLEIFLVNKERDSGVYKCEARSPYGRATTEAKLTVTSSRSHLNSKSKNYVKGKSLWDQYSSSLSKSELSDFKRTFRTDDIHVSSKRRQRRYSDTSFEGNDYESSTDLKTLYAHEKYAILKMNVKWDKDQMFYFREELKSKCVVNGNRVYLTCYVAGIQPFYAMWYKDGQRLSREEDYRYYIRSNGGCLSLEIPIAELDDTGEYKVEVRNEQGRIWSRCYVQIEPIYDPHTEYKKPSFIERIHHIHVKCGQTAAMSCMVTGHPKPAVQWFKDGQELQESERVTFHRGRKGAAMLMIYDAEFSDTGLYKCLAHSFAGRCESSAKLTVLDSLADLHQWVDTSCIYFEDGEIKIKRDQKKKDDINGTPPKPKPPRKSQLIRDKYLALDTAEIYTTPPKFTKPLPGTIDVMNGDDLHLQCTIDGFPKVKVVWMKEMEKVGEEEKVKMTSKMDSHSLQINNVDYKTDSGKYTAKLTNGLSETESTCHVLVLSTAGTVESKDISKESVGSKDYIPAQVKQTIASQEEINMQVPPRCESSSLQAGELQIPGVTPTGVQCHSSPLTNAEKEKELPLSKESPHFSQPLPEEFYPLERDENVRLQCKVAGDPCPKIVWFKDGEKLENSKKLKLEWDPETRIAGVLLKKLHILDTGDYECFAYSENGCFKTKSSLHIKALETQRVKTIQREEVRDKIKPKFLAELKDKKVLKGGCAKLDCVIQGVPAPEVKWYRDGVQLKATPGKITILSKEGHYSISIESFQSADQGCYTCDATNTSGYSSSTAYLSIDRDSDVSSTEQCPPEIAEKMEGVVVSQGGVAVFKCSAKGNPPPTFKWQKDMLDVSQSNKVTIDSSLRESTLTISNVTNRDSGMYVCVVKNKLGRTKVSARLIVNESSDKSRRMTWTGESSSATGEDEKSLSAPPRSGSMDTSAGQSEVAQTLEMKSDKETKEMLSDITEEAKVKTSDEAGVKVTDKSSTVSAAEDTEKTTESNKETKSKDVTEESTSTSRVSDTISKSSNDSKMDSTEEGKSVRATESQSEEKSAIAKGTGVNAEESEKIKASDEVKKDDEEEKKSSNQGGLTSKSKDDREADISIKSNEKTSTEPETSETKQEKAKESDQVKQEESSETTTDSTEVVSTTGSTETSTKDDKEKARTGDAKDVGTVGTKDTEAAKEETPKTEDASKKEDASMKEEEIDIDHLVKQAEEVLGGEDEEKTKSHDVSLEEVLAKSVVLDETVKDTSKGKTETKTSSDDLSFEEVLAKSVLDESVTEAASEMDKIKTKRRKFSKSKRRSDSIESEENLKNQENNGLSLSLESEESTKSQESKTSVTEASTEKESKTEEKPVETQERETSVIEASTEKESKTEDKAAEKLAGEKQTPQTDKDAVDGNVSSKSMEKVNESEKTVNKTEETSSSETSRKTKGTTQALETTSEEVKSTSEGVKKTTQEVKEASKEVKKTTQEEKSSEEVTKTSEEVTEIKRSNKVRFAEKHVISSDAISTSEVKSDLENTNKISAAKVDSAQESTSTTETASASIAEKKQSLTRMMSSEDFHSTIQMLDVGTLKANETRQAVLEQTTTSGKTRVLEVTARRVPREIDAGKTTEKQHTHSHHPHHPPEILLPPETQHTSIHSEIELTVKVKAAHGARVTWYHDGRVVRGSEHYEFFEEEFPLTE